MFKAINNIVFTDQQVIDMLRFSLHPLVKHIFPG